MALEKLQTQCKIAWQFLKSSPLAKKPWYLLIGPQGSGKTQLIIQSGLKIISTPHLNSDPCDEDENEHRCNWWYASDAIFIDMPGDYLSNPSDDKNFQSVLAPYFKRKPLSGILLTLSLPDWWSKNKIEQKTFATVLREILLTLTQSFKIACPLYLILTKTDQISGFSEFFSDLGQEERDQTWGFHFAPQNLNTTSLPRLFKNQFDQLLKRLNTRLIWRLHQERSLQKRTSIQQFPLQIEHFKNSLSNLIYQLADVITFDQKIFLSGVYFTSSLQQGTPIDCLHKTLSDVFALSPPLTPLPALNKQKSYFTQALFQKILSKPSAHSRQPLKLPHVKNLRIGIYVSAIGLVMSSGLLMAHDFNAKITQLNAAQEALAQYTIMAQQLPPDDNNLNQTLPALNLMQQANQLLQQMDLPGLFNKETTLPPLAAKTYHIALNNYFLPGLAHSLEQALTSSNDPNFLYGALKVYLMLGDPSHFDPVFVQNWLTAYWQQTLSGDPVLETQMENHLTALLTQPIPPVELKTEILTKTRTLLNNVPKPLLAYAILKAQDNDWIDPFVTTAKQAQAFNQVFDHAKPLLIPRIYTASVFQTIYFQQIPKASETALRGDWVLGTQTDSAINRDLINSVKLLYLHDYAQQWLALLNNLQITPWKDWKHAKTSLTSLSNNDSPLVKSLKLIATNTALTSFTASTTSMTPQDSVFIKNNLSDNFSDVENSLQNISDAHVAFKKLKIYLSSIGDDPIKALHASQLRFSGTEKEGPIETALSIARTLPQPLQNWVTTLANNSWEFILDNTKNYLNQTWQTHVLSFYQAHLDNRYPLFKTAPMDIALNEFAQFFAPNQILDNYVKNNLMPFIDTSQSTWHWRTVDGQSLNFSPTLLTQLERAAIIRTMFFDGDNNPIVQFALQPMAMGSNVTRVVLQINNQRFIDDPAKANTHSLLWPNTTQAFAVALTMTDDQNQSFHDTETGPWALFRLLDKANLQTADNTQNYLLTFDLNGNLARYQLSTNKLINPFIPGIIDQFRCPALWG